MRLARALAPMLALCVWLLPGAVRAAATEPRCVGVAALAGLAPGEQQRLTALCQGKGRPLAEDAPLLARMAARGGWEAAVLAGLSIGGAPHVDLGADAGAATRLLAVRRALRGLAEKKGLPGPGCKDVHAAAEAYVDDLAAREVPVPPFRGDTLGDGRCVPLDAATLADVQLLTIPGDGGDALFVAAAAGERVVLQWLAPEEAVVVRERRFYVVAVPAWSVVTVHAARQGGATARTWSGFVTGDQTLWDRPPDAGCLRLSVDLDSDTTLLLDGQVISRGQQLAHRTIGVQAGAHELVALRCAAPGQCVVRFRETLPESTRTSTQNLCQDVALDLHQPRSVAILPITTGPGCDAALAWQADLLAAEYLQRNEARTGRVFRDLASYATLTTALGSLRDSLNPSAGATVGASTGADSLELVATVAKEAWRQGIDELLSLELRCGADASAPQSLQGTVISVRDVFGRARGEVAGLDLKQLLRVQALQFSGAPQLESTVGGVLDQLLGSSYLRIREGAASPPYRQRARVELAAYGQADVDGKPELAAYHVGPPHRGSPQVCQALRGRDRSLAHAAAEQLLRATPAAARVTVRLGSEDGEVESPDPATLHRATATRLTGSLQAPKPGTWLLVTRWISPTGKVGPVVDATCVRFEVPPGELWASVMFAPDLTVLTPIRDYRAHVLRVQIGHTWYRPLRWLGLGVAGGYTYTRYISTAGLPSWQDFATLGEKTVVPLTWKRHAVVVGPLIEARSRRADLPVEFRGRLSASLGVAIVDVSEISDLPDFITPASFAPSSLRVRPTADATLELGFGYNAGPLAIAHMVTLGATGLNDMSSGARAVTATGGASLFVGLGLILGGRP